MRGLDQVIHYEAGFNHSFATRKRRCFDCHSNVGTRRTNQYDVLSALDQLNTWAYTRM